MATSNAAARKADATATTVAPGTLLVNGVKAVADLGVLPGASLLAEGDIKSGTLHAVGGLLAGALLGPIGWFAVGADSFSLSTTGKHIYQHFVSVQKVDE
jgi:hypothetical protein